MEYEIKNRFTQKVQFTAEVECGDDSPINLKIGLSVMWALKNRADLREADLREADLREADLYGANLYGANLCGANLYGANLRGANLCKADLREADLYEANLYEANLYEADLREANLRGANLYGANLYGANLCGADLVDGGQRLDGYRFVGWAKDGVLQIRAGCRDFDITNAWKHWEATRSGTPLGEETFCILRHIESVAKIRKLV